MSPVVLVVLIAWALLSVLFLTGTLLAARSIDRSVAVINPNVQQIGGEAEFIDQARTIRDKTVKIRAAAAPLSASLGRTDEVAKKQIDPRLKSILGKVGQINQVAGEINTTVLSIGGTVDSIFGNASSINSSVKSIGRSGRSILRSAQEINSSARSILGSGTAILSRVNSIDRAVATIVGQANTVIDVLGPVLTDFHGIRAAVGPPEISGHSVGSVHGHAGSIDCSTLLSGNVVPGLPVSVTNLLKPVTNLLAGPKPSTYCGK